MTGLDIVAVEIARGRMQAIVDEAAAALIRTAFSEIVRESKDMACSLLTPRGETIVQSIQSTPLFHGTTTQTAKRLLEEVPASAWKPGAVIGTNDPWLGTGHLNDLTLLTPIFVGGELVAHASAVAHLDDIGGRTLPVNAREMYEEGFRIPAMKLGTLDEIDPTVMELLLANVRAPDATRGDIEALLNACAVLSAGVTELCQTLTSERFAQVADALASRSESYIRSRLSELPDGEYRASYDSGEAGGAAFSLELRLRIAGDELHADFAGSSAQVPASINCCLAVTRSFVVFAVKCLLAPELPFNEGAFRPITVTAPVGSVLNSSFPAAGAARQLTAHFVPTMVFNALADVVPEAVIGDPGCPTPTVWITGVRPSTGTPFSAPVFAPGGFGARAHADGISSLVFPPNTQTVSVELMEANAPLLFDQQELVPGSGGAGRFRGGLARRVALRSLADSVQAQLLLQRLTRPAQGVHGGEAGTCTSISVNGKRLMPLPPTVYLQKGDVLVVDGPGGGGYGDPADRDPRARQADLDEGYEL
jgi:N-methylhydantoinase B